MSSEIYLLFIERLKEVRVYIQQGLAAEGDESSYKQLLAEIDESDLPVPEKEDLRTRVDLEMSGLGELGDVDQVQELVDSGADPGQHFEYGVALMDGQFWEEAIQEFASSAENGYRILQSWEYCGDCACKLERWEDAIGFYNNVYSDEAVTDELKKQILVKITRCSQTQKKIEVTSAKEARSKANAQPGEPLQTPAPAAGPVPAPSPKSEFITSSISSLDKYSVNQILGKTVTSWKTPSGDFPAGAEISYNVTNLLHVGTSSLIVELERRDSGEKFAGQILTGIVGEVLSPERLAGWVRSMMMVNSRRQVQMFDLAQADGHFFIVREYMPLSLSDILGKGEIMPIPIAIHFAYQVLEALGDLHLHMGRDEQIRNIFHLDLRPSRILLHKDRPWLKIYNGGLWRELEQASPEATAPKNLPLPYLSYRAPEQFRPYLARKRPPTFTDIYLFGALFYEMLTGSPSFTASSFGEYEIQHCEQYTSPPKVWRPEIPEEINEMIMNCLQSDPMRRWRSATQISLSLEKSFHEAVRRPTEDNYSKFLERLKIG